MNHLPKFLYQNYHPSSPDQGARFVLFEGQDGQIYVRISTSKEDFHKNIVERFMAESGQKADQENQFKVCGGGFYLLIEPDQPTSALEQKTKIIFGGESMKFGKFDKTLLQKILSEENLSTSFDWEIEN